MKKCQLYPSQEDSFVNAKKRTIELKIDSKNGKRGLQIDCIQTRSWNSDVQCVLWKLKTLRNFSICCEISGKGFALTAPLRPFVSCALDCCEPFKLISLMFFILYMQVGKSTWMLDRSNVGFISYMFIAFDWNNIQSGWICDAASLESNGQEKPNIIFTQSNGELQFFYKIVNISRYSQFFYEYYEMHRTLWAHNVLMKFLNLSAVATVCVNHAEVSLTFNHDIRIGLNSKFESRNV